MRGHQQAEGERRELMHSRSPEQSASFKKTSRPEATAEGPQAKASAGRCLAAGHAPNGVFQGQPAPACPTAHPWGAISRLASSGTTAPQRAKPALHGAWLACGECCVYQASEGMLRLQDNGFLESQKKLNNLPRWKIVPFHPLYNNSSFILL